MSGATASPYNTFMCALMPTSHQRTNNAVCAFSLLRRQVNDTGEAVRQIDI